MQYPSLIQRCVLSEGKLKYEYMGNARFETGEQWQSLERMFAAGLVLSQTSISVGGQDVRVFMVASEGFPFADYRYLQQLADYKLRLEEWTNFDVVVRMKAGIPTDREFLPQTNVWFDLRNDVFWTLGESDQKALLEVLENIKKSWAQGSS